MELPRRIGIDDHERETTHTTNQEALMYEVVTLVTTRARRRAFRPGRWGDIAAASLLVASIPVGLWLLANPTVGVGLVGLLCGLVVCRRHLTRRSCRERSDEAGPLGPVRTEARRSRR